MVLRKIRLTRARIFWLLSWSLLLGIVLGVFVQLGASWWQGFFVLGGFLVLLGWFYDKRLFFVGLSLLALGLGLVRGSLSGPLEQKEKFLFLGPAREKMSKTLESLYLPRQDQLLKAMLLGEKRALSYELKEILNQTGTRHIVAISGVHIGIIMGALLLLAGSMGFSKKGAVVWAVFLVSFYILLIGASPSAIRAGIMGSLLVSALVLGRGSRSQNTIVLAGLLMLLWEPQFLRSISFQLSFLAVLGIIFLKAGFDRLLVAIPNILKVRDILSISLAVQIALWPVLSYHFGRFSLVAPLVNLLIMPVLPILVIGGLVSVGVGVFWLGLGQVISWPVWLFGKYLLGVVDWFAQPGVAVETGKVAGWVLLLYYATLILVLWGLGKINTTKTLVS